MKAAAPVPYGRVVRYWRARTITSLVVCLLSPGPVGSPSVIVMICRKEEV